MDALQNTFTLLKQFMDEGRAKEEILPMAKMFVQDLSEWATESERDFIVKPWSYFEDLWKRTKWEIKAKIIPTWFKDIDSRIYWVFAWEIMTIAARTWVGKTTLWINMALNMLENYKVGFITLEMTKEDMLDRIMSRECNIYLWSFYSDSFKSWDIDNLRQYWAKAKEKIEKLILAYWCFNLDDILATINKMVDEGCEVVFIDWLWMINAPWNKRNEQMVTVMTSLKDLATSRNIAIVAMQQLNRQIDSIARDAPELSDIADSSAIEHISSPVLILWKNKDIQSDETYCSLFKTRRINEEAKQQCREMAEMEDKKRQDIFFKVKFKDDLWHCSFRDYDYNLPTNTFSQWKKPF